MAGSFSLCVNDAIHFFSLCVGDAIHFFRYYLSYQILSTASLHIEQWLWMALMFQPLIANAPITTTTSTR